MLGGLLELERDGALPLPEQIYRGLRSAISAGRVASGDRLPSSRALAASLDVSRNTVNAAYELLAAEGVVTVRSGAAPRVAALDAPDRVGLSVPAEAEGPGLSRRGLEIAATRRACEGRRAEGRLQPGVPALDCYPVDGWARTLRRAARALRGGALYYEELAGYAPLRRTLAAYLSRERGLRVRAEQILVTPSTQASLYLLANALADPGEVAWLEDPGYLGARAAFTAAGLAIRAMPVDEQGADPGAMAAAPRPRLIYVTPSHQYPLGLRMSLPRRLRLLEVARSAGAVVLEDDYDSEFLFTGRPIAALQGLSSASQTVYLGTFAKSMMPSLRVAYVVVPPQLVAPLRSVQHNTGAFANVATQAALADFIERGHYRAHLKRIRAVYQQRGDALVGALRAELGNAISVSLPAGGIQLSLRFAPEVDDAAIAADLNGQGYAVSPLSRYTLEAPLSGLVVGFAAATLEDVRGGAAAIAAALRRAGVVDKA